MYALIAVELATEAYLIGLTMTPSVALESLIWAGFLHPIPPLQQQQQPSESDLKVRALGVQKIWDCLVQIRGQMKVIWGSSHLRSFASISLRVLLMIASPLYREY
jgi:hypothetical protein